VEFPEEHREMTGEDRKARSIMTSRYLPIAALCLILIPGGHAAAASGEPISLDEIVALLRADVGETIIFRQLESESASLEIGVAEILILKEAGASDQLIELLMDTAGPEWSMVPATEEGSNQEAEDEGESAVSQVESLRMFKEKDDEGREYLHITNLDSSGRRLGGPARHRRETRVNEYDSSEDDRGNVRREEDYDDYREEDPPVIVNVYPPAPAETVAQHSHEDEARWPRSRYASRYPGGRLPGYYGYNVRGVPSPPGSYSHFVSRPGHDSKLYNGTLAYRSHYARHAGHAHQGSGVRRFRPNYQMIGPAAGRASITRYRSHFKNRK
jgi:hypothetical protein